MKHLTLTGALAPNFWILLLGRLLQAASGGITIMISVLTIPPSMNTGIVWVMAICLALTLTILIMINRFKKGNLQ